MGKFVRTILTIFAGLLGAGTLAFVVVIDQQQAAIRSILDRQSAAIAKSDSESQRSLSSLSDRINLLASNSSGAQGAVRRLQRKLSDELSTMRGSIADVAGALRERESVRMEGSAGAPSTPATLVPVPVAAAVTLASVSEDPPEMDLELSRALLRAKSLFSQGEFTEAARTLSPYMQQRAKNPEVRLYLAASRFHANPSDSSQYAGIEQDLRAVLMENADTPLALRSIGALCMEQGRWTEARNWLSQAIALQPADVDLLEKAGMCALAAGAHSDAEGYLDKAADLRPADADIWYAAGCAFAAAGDHENAYVRFEKCLALQPSHQGARMRAIQSLNELGRPAEATALADGARTPAGEQEQ